MLTSMGLELELPESFIFRRRNFIRRDGSRTGSWMIAHAASFAKATLPQTQGHYDAQNAEDRDE